MNGPNAGSPPQKRRLSRALMPRPCGEITSGSGGLSCGEYQAGRSANAVRRAPFHAVYVIAVRRTSSR
jgi:hypothetical protein